jgi:hypothetical protein
VNRNSIARTIARAERTTVETVDEVGATVRIPARRPGRSNVRHAAINASQRGLVF